MKLSDTVLCIASVSCSAPADAQRAWNIIPGRSAGAVIPTSSERDLVATYGPATVQASRAQPARLAWRGSTSLWQLPGGISLGSSLREIEGNNGRPFTLAGFGWDYGGVVVDWAGGAFDARLPGVHLYLDPGPDHYESAPYGKVLGDRDYSSTNEHMQSLNPRIYQIFMDFE